MSSLAQLQSWIVLGLSVVALGVEVYALVDCVRRRSDAFVAAGKRTKPFWLLVTGVAALLGVVAVGGFPGLLAIIAIVAAGVYLADVKPALDQVMGRGRATRAPTAPGDRRPVSRPRTGATASHATVSSPSRQRDGSVEQRPPGIPHRRRPSR